MYLRLPVQLPDGRTVTVSLSSPCAAGQIDGGEDRLCFDLPDQTHAYFTSTGHTDFSATPGTAAFPLEPGRAYRLEWSARRCMGDVRLWLIEYGPAGRLQHLVQPLGPGLGPHCWRTHTGHRTSCLAVRIAGRGELEQPALVIRAEEEALHVPAVAQLGPARRVALKSGQLVWPWTAPQPALPPEEGSWDNAGQRDFTVSAASWPPITPVIAAKERVSCGRFAAPRATMASLGSVRRGRPSSLLVRRTAGTAAAPPPVPCSTWASRPIAT